MPRMISGISAISALSFSTSVVGVSIRVLAVKAMTLKKRVEDTNTGAMWYGKFQNKKRFTE
jgi:hypothetical protein